MPRAVLWTALLGGWGLSGCWFVVVRPPGYSIRWVVSVGVALGGLFVSFSFIFPWWGVCGLAFGIQVFTG